MIENKKYDLIICSQEVKKIIKQRISQSHLNVEQICQRLDLDFVHIREYLRTISPIRKKQQGRGMIAQWELFRLSEALGINIKVTLMLSPFEDCLINKIKIAEQDATF